MLNDELLQVRTKKKEFLEQIESIVPWGEWITLIRPCYYKGERGNKPYDLELMLRIYLIQNLYDLADEATVAEVVDSRAFSDFCGVESSNQVPDGATRCCKANAKSAARMPRNRALAGIHSGGFAICCSKTDFKRSYLLKSLKCLEPKVLS